MKEITETIKTLTERITDDASSGSEAMQYAQAALNLAHTLSLLQNVERKLLRNKSISVYHGAEQDSG